MLADILNPIAPAFPFLTVLAGVVAAWLIRRSDRKDKAEEAKAAADRRDQDKRDAADRAREVARLIDVRAQELADHRTAQFRIVQLEAEKAHLETLARLSETHATAKEAFHEANGAKLLIVESNRAIADTNTKIEKVQE